MKRYFLLIIKNHAACIISLYIIHLYTYIVDVVGRVEDGAVLLQEVLHMVQHRPASKCFIGKHTNHDRNIIQGIF